MAAMAATLQGFQNELDDVEAEEIDILDFPDGDNPGLLLAHLAKRRKAGRKSPLHVVLVGRPFSARTAPAVTDPVTRIVSIEDAVGMKTQIDLKTFLAEHLKQGMNELRDAEHEKWLFEINTARFHAILRAAGFEESEYVFYHGGISQFAGISFKLSFQEFKGLKDVGSSIMDISTFQGAVEFTTKEEIDHFKSTWFGWSCEARVAYFKACRNAVSKELRYAEPLIPVSCGAAAEDPSSPKKTRTLRTLMEELAEKGAVFDIYSGAPFVELPSAVKPKVRYIAAMFGVLDDGKKNLCGENFNTLNGFNKSVDLVTGEFPNARIVFFPTSFYKTPEAVCTVPAETLAALDETSVPLKILVKLVAQWTALNPRGETQPLFDPAILLRLSTCARAFKLFEVDVQRRKNVYAVGTPFEDCALDIRHHGAKKTWLTAESTFPVGFYSIDAYGLDGAEGGNFEPNAKLVFLDFLRDVFCSKEKTA